MTSEERGRFEEMRQLMKPWNWEVKRRRCPVCGKLFIPTKPWNLYDSKECSRHARSHRRLAKIKRAMAALRAMPDERGRCTECGKPISWRRNRLQLTCDGICAVARKQRLQRQRREKTK